MIGIGGLRWFSCLVTAVQWPWRRGGGGGGRWEGGSGGGKLRNHSSAISVQQQLQ